MKKYLKGISFYVLLLVVILMIFALYNGLPSGETKKVYSDLYTAIKNAKVTNLTIIDDQAIATLDDKTQMKVTIPSIGILYEDLGPVIRAQVEAETLKVDTQRPPTPPWWLSILPTLLLVIIFAVFWFNFMQQAGGGGGGKINSFGKSKAKMMDQSTAKKVTFADVAGADEEKEELREIVDFLANPVRFTNLGARIPRGVLLVGPPGTGKTLLAKAVAGEAGVPFFSISGSDFVEMFVGVGASRVRDLFEQAKKSSPSIVFIDEIDAVGRHRGAGMGGGHDEREQTLNQLLVEMDGFGENQGVIIIAATNRPDILDPALLRPGRFDRQVVVGVPDIRGREDILKVHTRKKPLAENVKLDVIAKSTAGFSGADLENLTNEAALLAARESKTIIEQKDLESAIIKVIAGPEKKARVMSEKERRLTAFHEAGHALVTKLLPNQDPVHQVSIIPRGRAGGYTLSLPQEDKSYATKTDMLSNIIVLLGGRVAEKLVLDDISTGASNDIERATQIAKNMVLKYGMSDALGTIHFGSGSDEEVFMGRDFGHTRTYSENVASKIDDEIKLIIDDCYDRCMDILKNNLTKLDDIANVLLDKETIDANEFKAIFGEYVEPEETSSVDDANSENAENIDGVQTPKDSVDSANNVATETEFKKSPTSDKADKPDETANDKENA